MIIFLFLKCFTTFSQWNYCLDIWKILVRSGGGVRWVRVLTQWGGGGRSKRTSAYDVGREAQIFAISVRTY